MLTQRSRGKLVYALISAAGATLSAVNHAPLLATTLGVAAVVVWCVSFGRSLLPAEVDALLARLRDVRMADDARPPMLRATVTASVVAVPSAAAVVGSSRRTAIAFRDEMTAPQWRQLATALRHQPRPASR